MVVEALVLLETISLEVLNLLQQELVYSAIVFVIVSVLAFVCRRSSPHWLYGLWMLVMVRLILPPGWSFPYSARDWLQRFSLLPAGELSATPFSADVSRGTARVEMTNPTLEDRKSPRETSGPPSPYSIPFEYSGGISWHTAVFAAWLAGFVLFSIIYLKRRRRIRRLVARAVVVRHPELLELADLWRQRFRIVRRAELRCSDEFLSPFTIGLFHPKIFIPKKIVESGGSAAVQSIIAHEMAHIKRWDDLWIQLQSLVQLVYFFNPLAWYANSQINHARERICDRMVLSQQIIQARSYGRGMLTVLQVNLLGMEGPDLLPAFGNNKKRLVMRMQEIIGGTPMTSRNTIVAAVALALLVFFLLPMAPAVPEVIPPAQEQNSLASGSDADQNEPVEWTRPIRRGRVTSRFGYALDPFSHKRAHHDGIDIAAGLGTNVYAAAGGIVDSVKTGYLAGKGPGTLIILQHPDGFQTVYTHLNRLSSKTGQRVESGEVIGQVGSTGRSTGPHLHFEIRKDGRPVNPEQPIEFELSQKTTPQ